MELQSKSQGSELTQRESLSSTYFLCQRFLKQGGRESHMSSSILTKVRFFDTFCYDLWHFKDHLFYHNPIVEAVSQLKIPGQRKHQIRFLFWPFPRSWTFTTTKFLSVSETLNNDGLLFEMCWIIFLIEGKGGELLTLN